MTLTTHAGLFGSTPIIRASPNASDGFGSFRAAWRHPRHRKVFSTFPPSKRQTGNGICGHLIPQEDRPTDRPHSLLLLAGAATMSTNRVRSLTPIVDTEIFDAAGGRDGK